MILDKMEAFKALDHYDIHVARSKYIDSAEDAVAFAERRNARDPRFMPIVLRAAAATTEGHAKLAAEKRLDTVEAVRQAYEEMIRQLGTSDRRILGQTATEPGTDIMISGETNEALGKTIALHSATHAVQRMAPLDASGAEALVQNFEGYHHHGSREQVRRMLEHLLIKISKFFEETAVTQFQLDVRLHGNSYTVLDASMTGQLHLKERLETHARDEQVDPRAHGRKGDEFHPAPPAGSRRL